VIDRSDVGSRATQSRGRRVAHETAARKSRERPLVWTPPGAVSRRKTVVPGRLRRILFRFIFGSRSSVLITFLASTWSMKQSVHSFLRRLRAGGRSNMYGAIPYVMRRFGLDRDTAFRLTCEWIDAQDAAELVSSAATSRPTRLPGRTPSARPLPRKRSRAKS
jgi:hypothetical protein